MEKKYKVGGMACGGCSASMERALKALPGVETASVNHVTGIAEVIGEIDSATIASVVENLGFDFLGEAE